MLRRLRAQNVLFCHWKSNRGLANALAGNEDLDILTSKSDSGKFTSVLAELEFKQVRSGLDRDFPGIEDYIGFDAPSGKIVHLQLHYRLILGEPLIKNYLFPVESQLLQSLDSTGSMPIPEPAAELAIFVLRILIKFKPYHLLKPAVVDRLLVEAREEFAFLGSCENGSRASILASEYFPGLPPDLFIACIQAFEGDVSSREILNLRRKVIRVLRKYRRRSSVDATIALIQRRSYISRWRRSRGRPPKRTPASGGLLLAIIGPDGSGKSTAIEGIDRWLSPFLNVTRGHMGKPPPRLVSRVVNRLVALHQRLTSNTTSPARTHPDSEVGGSASGHLLHAWQLACLARDRKRESERLLRAAQQGELVLCDRYPMPGLHTMEGLHGHRLRKARGRLFQRWMHAEKQAHESIRRPDLTIGLRVPPEIASARQPEDGVDFVSFRAQEFFTYSETPRENVVIIDASAALEDVSAQTRELVWQAL
jgi:thymidylate kinase